MKEFTLDEAMAARRVMRDALNAGPERFPLPAFIGMLSDEIEQLRNLGMNNQQIASMICNAVGKPLEAFEVAEHYAPPEARQR